MVKVRNELDFKNWFMQNYEKLGFSKMLNIGWNTAEIGLLNLGAEDKVEKIKKRGANIGLLTK